MVGIGKCQGTFVYRNGIFSLEVVGVMVNEHGWIGWGGLGGIDKSRHRC